ncbi:MAG: carboxypeptidase-like regulatory domain-containing protein, partial [Maribacter sp.]|nr:carboxypeptidase-like regulatory domain-containing protein [Maribacter sp.]
MRKQILFLLVLSFLTSSSFSQEYEIQGKIISADQEAIWLANVLLLSALDSILIDGSSTDGKGLFKITNIPPGDYLLKASYLENESDFLNLAINADLDIGTLTIANYAQVLDEVIVSTQKPRVERKVD